MFYLHGLVWNDDLSDILLILEAYALLLWRLAALVCASGRMFINWKRLCLSPGENARAEKRRKKTRLSYVRRRRVGSQQRTQEKEPQAERGVKIKVNGIVACFDQTNVQ